MEKIRKILRWFTPLIWVRAMFSSFGAEMTERGRFLMNSFIGGGVHCGVYDFLVRQDHGFIKEKTGGSC